MTLALGAVAASCLVRAHFFPSTGHAGRARRRGAGLGSGP